MFAFARGMFFIAHLVRFPAEPSTTYVPYYQEVRDYMDYRYHVEDVHSADFWLRVHLIEARVWAQPMR